jgi:hypothetical protein
MAFAYEAPRPGDPAALLDWRWLARPQVGERRVSNDPWGKRKLPPAEGGFLALDIPGPGVLDHLWASISGNTRLAIEVDGKTLWQGPFGQSWPEEKGQGIFPALLLFQGGGMQHLVAPVGFQKRLRLITDKPAFLHFASYRTFPEGTAVLVADPDPNGRYAQALGAIAQLWSKQGYGLHASPAAPARVVEVPLALPAKGRATAIQQDGSGEILSLEFHMNPALTGTLRQVVVELCYGQDREPALRLPITDLVGMPHPWPCGRWDRYNGDLIAGLRYPWYESTPREHFPEATFHLNLPIPFTRGVRVELVNRSATTQFVGHARGVLAPLAEREGADAGRLCGARVIRPVRAGAEPQPLIEVPGPGHVVGLSLFMTGNSQWPPAVHESVVAFQADGGEPILGQGVVPLWFKGIYGGPVQNRVIWNHPRLEEGYVGATRHFLTDPLSFQREARFGYTPGPKGGGAPTQATVVALWYHFGSEAYAAPSLPEEAEPLPHSAFGDGPMTLGPGKEPARLAWATEAEDLVPMATARQTELRVVEDAEHDYHPSAGKYLHIVADRPGSHVDFAVRLPSSRYIAVGVYPLWGPGRGTFELQVLSREEAKAPPFLAQGDAFFVGRMLGHVPVKAPVFSGDALDRRRDPNPHHTPPMLNPAPDQAGVLRLVCQAKPMTSSTHLLKLDRLRLDTPPPTEAGWLECEGMPGPATSGAVGASGPLAPCATSGPLVATSAKYGRFEWSGWGALLLSSRPGGKATLSVLVPTGPARPTAVRLKGCLGPDQGKWEARVEGCRESAVLAAGTNADEVVEWSIPAAGVSLPGPVVLELTCTGAGKDPRRGDATHDAQLALDALAFR